MAQASDFTLSATKLSLELTYRTETTDTRKETIAVEVPNLYEDEVTAFSRCVLENIESPVPGLDGWRNQKVLDAAMKGGGTISYE